MKHKRSVLRSFVGLLGLTSLSGGCKDEIEAAQYVDPSFGDPCEFTDCAGVGMCRASAEGAPQCLCEPGYRGAECESCEAGFHRDALERCVADRSCLDEQSDPCGQGGDCIDSAGVITCACDEGYEGPRCTLCADRYRKDELGRCLPLYFVLDPATPPPADMTCDDGYTGPICSQCAPGYHADFDRCVLDELCATDSCPTNATCAVVAGEVACTCKPEYTGTNCFACAEGFHPRGDACVPDEICLEDSCPLNATCRVVEGAVECPCDPGYDDGSAEPDLDCSACASGYHQDEAGACVANQSCEPDACPEHATCAVIGGAARCTCLPGYTGEQCDECQSGFHKAGEACVLDEYCELNSCPLHATCSVEAGEVTCPCDPGWSPAGECHVCESYATERSGFEFPTGWPTRENACFLHVELAVAHTTFRSRVGPDGPEGDVYQCARSTYSKMNSQHVELFSYTHRPATLTFDEPAHLVAFDYGSRVEALELEVRAHELPSNELGSTGRVVGAIELGPNQREMLTLVLDPPARVISFWSVNGRLQHIALDDVIYSYPECR